MLPAGPLPREDRENHRSTGQPFPLSRREHSHRDRRRIPSNSFPSAPCSSWMYTPSAYPPGGTQVRQRLQERTQKVPVWTGSFKIDWALAGPIPWRAGECLLAGTVHVGGTMEEIAAGENKFGRTGIRNSHSSLSRSRAFSTTPVLRVANIRDGPTVTFPTAPEWT